MRSLRVLTTILLTLSLAGCASHRAFREGEIATQLENWDAAVAHYMRAAEDNPSNIQYRAALLRAKIAASQFHFEKAKEFQEAGVYERALMELQQAVQLDPTNQYAEAELDNVHNILAAQRENRDYAGSVEEIKDRTREARPQPPMLNPRSKEKISLDFPEMTPIFDIYRALGKAFGINVLFDTNLKDQEISISLKDVTAEGALEILMRTSGHFYKVLDEHSILIAADTPQNRRTYEDLVVQNFFLSNAEVKDILTIIRSLVDAKKIAVNEQLNAIILRDTADKVKIAERIIEANDKAKAEVVIDVELLQIDTGKLRDLGVALSEYSITQSLDLGGENVPLRLSDFEFLNQSNWLLSVPNFIYQFEKQNTSAQLLAKPRLRITEGEKARLVIGDRVPIPVTTFNTGNTVGGNIVPITSFQYQEVGITIDIEPRVHHNKEITLKVKVEVSNISGFISGPNGQEQPRIGTRTIDTTIRLRDGETNLLAGLIRTDESESDQGVPGLSEIPVLGRLFSKRRSDNQRTDVLLTLTPHIIRDAQITEQDLLPIWVGTEANLTFRGGSPRVESNIEGPFDTGGTTPEEIQELMRRRLQQLPRGLRQDDANGDEQPPDLLGSEPQGLDLVPNPFGQEVPEEVPDAPSEEPPPPGLLRPVGGGSDDPENQVSLPSAEPAEPTTPARPRAAAASSPAQLPLSDFVQVTPARALVRRELDEGETVATAAAPAARPAEARPAPQAAVELSFETGRRRVLPGETFEVSLRAKSRIPVSHLPITLGFDPALLALESVESGGFLGEASRTLSDESRPGVLTLGASRLGDVEGVEGAGEVARLTFRALAPGAAKITFLRGEALDEGLREVGPVMQQPLEMEVDTLDFQPLEPRLPPPVGPET